MKRINKVGQRFGKLKVIDFAGKNRGGNYLFLCECDCGNQKVIPSVSLRVNKTQSCGCIIGSSISHGFSRRSKRERIYKIFTNINSRCNNSKTNRYYIYGGRGIKCLWKSFEEFRDDMYESYLNHVKKFGEKNTQIDRIDVNGNYYKENCRWATHKEQANNMRKNRLITFRDETLNLTQWAEKTGIKMPTIKARIDVFGWPIERALTAPVK